MGIFGWSLPPGAAGDPSAPWNEEGAEELTHYLEGLTENVCFFWLEDNTLCAQTYGEHGMEGDLRLGCFDWGDDLPDEANLKAAAIEALKRYTERNSNGSET